MAAQTPPKVRESEKREESNTRVLIGDVDLNKQIRIPVVLQQSVDDIYKLDVQAVKREYVNSRRDATAPACRWLRAVLAGASPPSVRVQDGGRFDAKWTLVPAASGLPSVLMWECRQT